MRACATPKRIEPALEFVKTARGDVIDHADRPVEYLYFVSRGLISLVMTMKDGRTVEIGVVGIEGVTNANALFDFTGHPSTPWFKFPDRHFASSALFYKTLWPPMM
jgi:hypothetical protein